MSEVRGAVPVDRARRWTVTVAIAGTVVVAMFAALGAVQVLVLNPLAAVPGATLDQIDTELAAAGESLGAPLVLLIMALGAVLAGALLVLTLRGRPTTRVVAIGYLTLIMLGTPVYWVASFGAGMALADTYGISGADYSPWSMPLHLAGGAALTALVVLLGTGQLERRRAGRVEA
jgi:hypothetical protein